MTGDVEEVHHRVARGADLAQLVDLDLVAAQVPVVVRRDARRVLRVRRLVHVGAGEADLARACRATRSRSRRTSASSNQPISRLRWNLTSGPLIQSLALAQRDVALAPDLVVADVVLQPVGEHRLAPRAQLDAGRRPRCACPPRPPAGPRAGTPRRVPRCRPCAAPARRAAGAAAARRRRRRARAAACSRLPASARRAGAGSVRRYGGSISRANLSESSCADAPMGAAAASAVAASGAASGRQRERGNLIGGSAAGLLKCAILARRSPHPSRRPLVRRRRRTRGRASSFPRR